MKSFRCPRSFFFSLAFAIVPLCCLSRGAAPSLCNSSLSNGLFLSLLTILLFHDFFPFSQFFCPNFCVRGFQAHHSVTPLVPWGSAKRRACLLFPFKLASCPSLGLLGALVPSIGWYSRLLITSCRQFSPSSLCIPLKNQQIPGYLSLFHACIQSPVYHSAFWITLSLICD